LKLLSLVVPTLDIDLENDTRATFCKKVKDLSSEEAKKAPSDENTLTPGDIELLSHIGVMDEMSRSYSKLGIHLHSPRSIYEPHGSSGLSKSNKDSLNRRIENQVLCKHLQISEVPDEDGGADDTLPSDVKQQNNSSYQNERSNLARRRSSAATSIHDRVEDFSRIRDLKRESLLQPVPEEQNELPNQAAGQGPSTVEPTSQQHKEVQASSSQKKAESKLKEKLQGIVTAQLWVLMIYVDGKPERHNSGPSERLSPDENGTSMEGSWTVVTAFPDRWDTAINPSLQSRIRNALYPIRVGLEEAKVTELIEQILSVCVNFIEETIHLSKPVMYSNVFAAAIAGLVSFINS
jgi:hypothetical protein